MTAVNLVSHPVSQSGRESKMEDEVNVTPTVGYF